MSPYFTITPLIPLRLSNIWHIKILYKYYDNLIVSRITKNFDKINFLLTFLGNLRVKLISVFYDSRDTQTIEEINFVNKFLRVNNVCANIYYITFTKHEEQLSFLVDAKYSSIFMFIFENYDLSLKMINFLNKCSSKHQVIMYYKTNWSYGKKTWQWFNELRFEKIANICFQIFQLLSIR